MAQAPQQPQTNRGATLSSFVALVRAVVFGLFHGGLVFGVDAVGWVAPRWDPLSGGIYAGAWVLLGSLWAAMGDDPFRERVRGIIVGVGYIGMLLVGLAMPVWIIAGIAIVALTFSLWHLYRLIRRQKEALERELSDQPPTPGSS